MATAAELKILRALDQAPDKQVKTWDLRKAVGLTFRGYGIVERRMRERHLIDRMPDDFATVTLTFKGMRALAP